MLVASWYVVWALRWVQNCKPWRSVRAEFVGFWYAPAPVAEAGGDAAAVLSRDASCTLMENEGCHIDDCFILTLSGAAVADDAGAAGAVDADAAPPGSVGSAAIATYASISSCLCASHLYSLTGSVQSKSVIVVIRVAVQTTLGLTQAGVHDHAQTPSG